RPPASRSDPRAGRSWRSRRATTPVRPAGRSAAPGPGRGPGHTPTASGNRSRADARRGRAGHGRARDQPSNPTASFPAPDSTTTRNGGGAPAGWGGTEYPPGAPSEDNATRTVAGRAPRELPPPRSRPGLATGVPAPPAGRSATPAPPRSQDPTREA